MKFVKILGCLIFFVVCSLGRLNSEPLTKPFAPKFENLIFSNLVKL